MRRRKFRKYAGIITLLLFFAVFIPSALSQAERTADRGTGSSSGVRMADSGTADAVAEGKIAAGIGVGTIAVGTAIAEAAVIAVAASQLNTSNPTTIH
jgi:hypothetical protein